MPANPRKPLFISARRNSWRMLDWHANETDKRYAAVRSQILKRDNYTCAYCSARFLKFQQIHHIDHDHGNVKDTNLATACPLCHQCFHLGLAGVNHTGYIIWLPEISQSDLNNMVRAIFVAIHTRSEHEKSARALYEALQSRTTVIEDVFGEGTSNPSAFGQAFVEMDPKDYSTRKERMPGLRLLARIQGFGQEVAYWSNDPDTFGKLSAADWTALLPEMDFGPDPEMAASDDGANDVTFDDANASSGFEADRLE